MNDSVKYYAAMCGLKLLDTVFSIGGLVSHFCGMVYSSTFSIVTGLENTWCFYEGEAVPVQQRFTSSTRCDNIEWYYYKRTKEWVHRTAVYRKTPKRCPWMLVNLVKPNGDTEDLSEFFAGHRFYMPQGYIQWPTAEQMLAAWSIESYEWYLGEKRETTMMTVMDKCCAEHSFYISLEDEDSLRAYWRTFGMTYSADSSAVPSEQSSETETEEEDVEEEDVEEAEEEAEEEQSEDTEETEEVEEAVEVDEAEAEEHSEEDAEETDKTEQTEDAGETEAPHEEAPTLELGSDTELVPELPASTPSSANRMDEVD